MATQKKKKKEISFGEKMLMLKKAGMERPKQISTSEGNSLDALDSIDERISKILEIVYSNKNGLYMIYFVMYDIEDNKVRKEVSKYLEKKGLVRIQKSIFFGNTKRDVYTQIHQDLKEVNSVYENADSIVMVPVSTDEVKAMKLIGSNVDFDIIMQNRNTLFF